MSTTKYVPGGVPTVVGPGFVAMVLNADAELLEQLWDISLHEPELVQVLELLGAGGFSQMPAFAAVVWDSTSANMVFRGDVRLEAFSERGTDASDAREVSTWVERRFDVQEFSGLRFSFALNDEGSAANEDVWFPVTGGVVFASGVTIGSPPETVDESESAEAANEVALEISDLGAEPETETSLDDDSLDSDDSVMPLIEEEPEASEPAIEPETELDADALPSDDPNATVAEPEDVSFDALFGATIMGRKPEDAAVRDIPDPDEIADQEESSVEDVSEDERTMTPEKFAKLRAARGLNPASQADSQDSSSPDAAFSEIAPMPPEVRFVPRLVLSTGREITVDRSVLFGRAPQARNTAGADLPELVVLDDPYVSGTHLEVTVSGNQLMATDMSTNGTLMIVPGSPPISLVRNEATLVPLDAVLKVSEELSITVVASS